MMQHQSAASLVANEVFAAKRDEVMAAVLERLDLDALVDRLWERIRDDVIERLTRSGWMSQYQPEQEKMRALINDKIATELARRTIERLDADGHTSGGEVERGGGLDASSRS